MHFIMHSPGSVLTVHTQIKYFTKKNVALGGISKKLHFSQLLHFSNCTKVRLQGELPNGTLTLTLIQVSFEAERRQYYFYKGINFLCLQVPSLDEYVQPLGFRNRLSLNARCKEVSNGCWLVCYLRHMVSHCEIKETGLNEPLVGSSRAYILTFLCIKCLGTLH